MFLLYLSKPFRQRPPFCFCLSCQQLSPDWLSLSFYCFLSQSEPICNLHRCYTILNPCFVLCTHVYNKVALVFSQSESSNFCMYIITTINNHIFYNKMRGVFVRFEKHFSVPEKLARKRKARLVRVARSTIITSFGTYLFCCLQLALD